MADQGLALRKESAVDRVDKPGEHATVPARERARTKDLLSGKHGLIVINPQIFPRNKHGVAAHFHGVSGHASIPSPKGPHHGRLPRAHGKRVRSGEKSHDNRS